MSSIFREFFNLNKDDREAGKVEYINEKPTNKEIIKIKASVHGIVQGVGFRFSTKHLADEIGVDGMVRNEHDGSVYIEASGTEDQIKKFITELAKGPAPGAVVDKVVVEYDDSIPDYNGFGERH